MSYNRDKDNYTYRSFIGADDPKTLEHSHSTSTKLQTHDHDNSLPSESKGQFTRVSGQILDRIDWKTVQLEPFQKNFYVESDAIRNRPQSDVDDFRKKSEMTVIGENIPNPIQSFVEAGFPAYLLDQIDLLGFEKPTPIQCQGWPMALSGRDVVGIAQTGSGKTLSFCIPALLHIKAQPPLKKGDGPIALILVPTRELSEQILQDFIKFGSIPELKSASVCGGSPKQLQISALNEGVEIVIATPGRLIEFLASSVTNLHRVTYLVLDEADRMLDMGFEPQLRLIFEQIRPDRQVLMWSATWSKEVQALAKDYLNNYLQVNIGSLDLSANHSITQLVRICTNKEKSVLLQKAFQKYVPGEERVVIFVSTKEMAHMLYMKLKCEAWAVGGLHGNISQTLRDIVLREFKEGKSQILVATDLVSRGLDVPDVKLVINYDYPKDTETYIHRIGRTGRGGNTGTALTFFTENDSHHASALVEILREANQTIPKGLLRLCNDKGRTKFRK